MIMTSKVSQCMDKLIKGRAERINGKLATGMLILPTMNSKQNLSPTSYTLEASTINDIDGCKCDDAVKVKAIKNVLENSKDVDSNLIIQKVKHILKPIKYSDEYFEEDDTKIKLEPVTVKTEPFIKAESIKTEPEDDTKIKLEPISVKTESCFKVEESRRKLKRSRSCSPKLSPKRLGSQSPHDFEQSFCHDNETNKTQKRKNAKMPQRHSDTESWECPKCLRRCKPRDKLSCYHCGALRPGSWFCHLCDNRNYPEQLRCGRRACGEIRRGNWICPDPDCQFLNWQHSLQCFRTECHEAQPGSWLCRACDVINKRDNETCFLCNDASSNPAQVKINFEFNAEAEKLRQAQERIRQQKQPETEVSRLRPSSPKLSNFESDSNRKSRGRVHEEESGTDWHQVFDEMRVENNRKTEENNAKDKVVQNRLLALVGQTSSIHQDPGPGPSARRQDPDCVTLDTTDEEEEQPQAQPLPCGSMSQNPNLEPLGIPRKQQKSKVNNYDNMTEVEKDEFLRQNGIRMVPVPEIDLFSDDDDEEEDIVAETGREHAKDKDKTAEEIVADIVRKDLESLRGSKPSVFTETNINCDDDSDIEIID